MTDLYIVVTWPDIQDLMSKRGFKKNAFLINDDNGLNQFGSSAYFVKKDWYDDATKSGDFPITTVCRDDLESRGFNTSKVTNAQMRELADKMEDAYCENGFWEDLTIIAEEALHIPKRRNG